MSSCHKFRIDSRKMEQLLRLIAVKDYVKALSLTYDFPGPLGSELRLAITELLSGGESSCERRGIFIVITGIDKTGKETHCFNPKGLSGVKSVSELLKEFGLNVVPIKQPNYDTLTGQVISSILKRPSSCELKGSVSTDLEWLLWSLNRALDNIVVRNWLRYSSKNVVLAKRWTESNIAYYSVLGVSPKMILELESRIEKPDLVLVLDAPPNSIAARLDTGADKFENIEFLTKVREAYLKLEQTYPYGSLKYIDARGSLIEVNRAVIDTIRSFLATITSGTRG